MTLVVKISLLKLFLPNCETRSALLTSFLLFGVLFINGCGQAERETLRFAGETMGTTYHVTLVADKDARLTVDADALQKAVDVELRKINQHMSTYIPDSELMLFNAASVGEWYKLSQPLEDVLQLSRQISERSGGTFDITVGPLVNLWGFGPGKHDDKVPDPAAVAAAQAKTGYEKLELADGQARKLADISLDLSAIAKGYGVDWIADYIARQGIDNYMVEIGGEIRVKGTNPKGQPWRIAIEQPSMMQQSVHKAISFTDAGMATSGDYRNYFEQDGKRYSHTIDPETGYPITHRLASVTVIANTSAEADGWATAINVLGPEKGMEVANREKLAVYMIVKEDEGFSDRYSTAFEPYR